MSKTNAIECSNLTEARRILAKIHAQPEIAQAIAEGRMTQWADADSLIKDDVTGKLFIQWDGPHITRRARLKAKLEDEEKAGTLTPTERDEDGNQTKAPVFEEKPVR